MSSSNSYIYVSVPCFFIFLFCFKNVKFTITYLRGVTSHFCTLSSYVYIKSGGVRNLLLKMRAKKTTKKTTLNLEGVKHYIITKQKLGFLINLSYLSLCFFFQLKYRYSLLIFLSPKWRSNKSDFLEGYSPIILQQVYPLDHTGLLRKNKEKLEKLHNCQKMGITQ